MGGRIAALCEVNFPGVVRPPDVLEIGRTSPALAASIRATRMSSCARRFCLGRAHVYLGHARVRPDQPPRARD